MSEFKKSVFGYNINFTYKKNNYIASIPTLGITQKGETIGGAIRQIFKSAVDYIDNLEKQTKKIPTPDNYETYHGRLQHRMVNINRKISKFGYCLIPEYMTGQDFLLIEKAVEKIELSPELSQEELQQIENELGNIFIKTITLPANRALIMSSMIMHTDYVSEFSHLVEKAYFHLMVYDHISVNMILTPVIEGILTAFVGHNPLSINPPKKNVIYNKLAELQYADESKQMTHPFLFDEYIRCFIDICDNVFFNTTDKAADANYFNRNYITHLAGNERFYSRNNSIKIILLLDLLTFVIACSRGQNDMFYKDIEDKDYLERWEYYKVLALFAISKGKAKEYELLLQHKNFKNYL
jgi:hypothetical protein